MTSVRVSVSIAAYLVHYMAQVSLHVLLQVYRRWINTEEKAKVDTAVWGTELIQFLAAQAILPRTILKNRINSSFSSDHPLAVHLIHQSVPVQNS